MVILCAFVDAFGQHIAAQESFWQQKEQAIDEMLSDCDGDQLKDDKLFSFAAEVQIELMTLVCENAPILKVKFINAIKFEIF